MNTFVDFAGQYDSVKEELEDVDEQDIKEDLVMQATYASTARAITAMAHFIQTRYNVAPPTVIMRTYASIKPSTFDPHKKAHWTTFQEAVLIQLLFERKNEMTSRTMFKDAVFKQASKALNRFHKKGTRKTATSCRSKWTRLKKTYNVVTMLKSKSGFVWDDLKGMQVTPEKRQAWDELVKSNKQFKPFATNGWPHYDAMARLMPSRARSAYARRDTHKPIVEATVSTSVLPPASIDIPPSSTPDASSQSSSPNGRFLSPENTLALKGLIDALEVCVDAVCEFCGSQQHNAPAPS